MEPDLIFYIIKSSPLQIEMENSFILLNLDMFSVYFTTILCVLAPSEFLIFTM